MTVGSKMHMAVNTAESLRAQLDQFGLDSEGDQVKADYFRAAEVVEQQIVPALKQRLSQVEAQEPQYRVKQNAIDQAWGTKWRPTVPPPTASSVGQPPAWEPPAGTARWMPPADAYASEEQ